jgi:hypothetical protein
VITATLWASFLQVSDCRFVRASDLGVVANAVLMLRGKAKRGPKSGLVINA